MNKVVVKIEGIPRLELDVADEPTNELGMTKYKEYIDLCYEVGLGAPVVVEVTTKGWFSSKKNKFRYIMKGNSITFQRLTEIIRLNSQGATCEEMNQDDETGAYNIVYSFKTELFAKVLCRELDRICNVGCYAFKDTDTGRFIVVIDFFPVYDI